MSDGEFVEVDGDLWVKTHGYRVIDGGVYRVTEDGLLQVTEEQDDGSTTTAGGAGTDEEHVPA